MNKKQAIDRLKAKGVDVSKAFPEGSHLEDAVEAFQAFRFVYEQAAKTLKPRPPKPAKKGR